jgi:hypothetical protein
MITEGTAFAQGGASTSQSKKRLNYLHKIATEGVNDE